jgi:tRNA1(Val) A37 N6-methylase TrmN6
MVEAVRSAVRELKVESPVVVYQDAEHYRPDVEAWVGKKRRV